MHLLVFFSEEHLLVEHLKLKEEERKRKRYLLVETISKLFKECENKADLHEQVVIAAGRWGIIHGHGHESSNEITNLLKLYNKKNENLVQLREEKKKENY